MLQNPIALASEINPALIKPFTEKRSVSDQTPNAVCSRLEEIGRSAGFPEPFPEHHREHVREMLAEFSELEIFSAWTHFLLGCPPDQRDGAICIFCSRAPGYMASQRRVCDHPLCDALYFIDQAISALNEHAELIFQ